MWPRINHFQVLKYRKSSIKLPMVSFISNTFEGVGGLKIDVAGIWEGDLHKELKYKSEKLKYKNYQKQKAQRYKISWWIKYPGSGRNVFSIPDGFKVNKLYFAPFLTQKGEFSRTAWKGG